MGKIVAYFDDSRVSPPTTKELLLTVRNAGINFEEMVETDINIYHQLVHGEEEDLVILKLYGENEETMEAFVQFCLENFNFDIASSKQLWLDGEIIEKDIAERFPEYLQKYGVDFAIKEKQRKSQKKVFFYSELGEKKWGDYKNDFQGSIYTIEFEDEKMLKDTEELVRKVSLRKLF